MAKRKMPSMKSLELVDTLPNGKQVYKERAKAIPGYWSQIWNSDVWVRSDNLIKARAVSRDPK